MKRIAFILSILSIQLTGFAQLGVGTNSPDASAQLDVTASDKGFLAPRIALTSVTDVLTIASPATGLMVYNTATAGTSPNNVFPGYYYYNGTRWSRFVNTALNATVSFNTADPNTGSPTFTPNTPQSTDYIYVSAVNSSLWVWNGSAYVSYAAPGNTPFYKNNTTTDAGGDKTSGIYRTGSISIGTNNTTRLLDVVNSTSTYTGLIEAEGVVTSNYSRAVAIRMRRGTSASPSAIQLNDISAYGFSGYDGAAFSTTSAGMAGIATQNWTSTAKGMGLVFSTTQNSTTSLIERMRIDHNGSVGIGITVPLATLQVQHPTLATNTINVDANVLRLSRTQTPGVKWDNIAQFNLGSYAVTTGGSTNATSRLDLALNDGNGLTTSNVMTWQANGQVGVNTTAPYTNLDVLGNIFTSVHGSTNLHDVSEQTSKFIGHKSGNTTDGFSGMENEIGAFGNIGQANGSKIHFLTWGNNIAASRRVMTINQYGYVGIGTTSPASALHVIGVINEDITSQDNYSNGLNIRKRGNSSAATGAVASGAEIGYHSFYGWNGTGYARGAYVFASASENYTATANGTNYAIFTTANGTTANVERFKIMHNGNVGIGTGNPNGALTLYGPSSLALPANIQGATGATKELVFGKGGLFNNFAAITGVENGQYGGGLSFIVKPSGSDNFPTNAIQAMVLDWNGNMGLGTGFPTQRLDVNGTALFRNGNTSTSNTNNQLLFGYSSTNTYQHAIKTRHNNVSATNNAIDFYLWSNTDAVSAIGSKHVMTLEATGNVGVGLTAPTQSLDVNGRVRIRTIDTGVTTDSVLVVNGGVVKSVSRSATVNTQTANYTLTTSDNGSVLIMNSATAVTVTVPATLPAGFVVQIIQKGAGQVTVTGSGSTINSANGFKTRTLNSAIGVVMESSTLGYVTGDSNF